MADSAGEADEEGKLDGVSPENNGGGKKRVVRQPNRRQHEKDVQALTEDISAKEAELKSLGRPNIEASPEEVAERESLQNEQKRIRELKEATIAKRKECDDNIHKISDLISKQHDALSRLKANLPHKTERAVEEAIQKLEYQLRTQHFKLRDEKRIVNEITTLKRSKKQIREYQEKRMVVEVETRKKDEMKKERNIHFRKVSELKAEEDKIRQQLQRLKSKADEAWTRYREAGSQREQIKKDVDNLYETRRQLNAEFQAQQREFRESYELQRIENEQRKDDERKAMEAKHRKEWFEYEQNREPFQEERVQIECLMTYLKKLQPKGEGQGVSPYGGSPQNGASPVTSVSSSSSLGRSSSFKDEEGTFTVLRKKTDEDDEVFLQAASRKRRSKRKSWVNKPLRHTREIFNQFASIEVTAPSTALEISEVMEKLQNKLQYYEDAAASVKMAHSAIPNDFSTTSSVSSGIVTATDFEDMLDSTDEDLRSCDDIFTPRNVQAANFEDDANRGTGEGPQAHIREGLEGLEVAQKKVEDVHLDDGQRAASIGESAESLCVENSESGDVGSERIQAAFARTLDNERDSVKQHAADASPKSESSAEESGSNGSDDGKEAGNVTDDSESTVVANECESGQNSPSDASSGKALDDSCRVGSSVKGSVDQAKAHVDEGNIASDTMDKVVTMTFLDADVNDDKDDADDHCHETMDKEDSGMMDVLETEPKRAGIAERKNETLRLIVSQSGEKELEQSKSDLLGSSHAECSSDYASNSTGSAVSTPTDLAMLAKREPPLIDADPLSPREMGDAENVFQMMEREREWRQGDVQLSQGALRAHDDALHSNDNEEQTADTEQL